MLWIFVTCVLRCAAHR